MNAYMVIRDCEDNMALFADLNRAKDYLLNQFFKETGIRRPKSDIFESCKGIWILKDSHDMFTICMYEVQ